MKLKRIIHIILVSLISFILISCRTNTNETTTSKKMDPRYTGMGAGFERMDLSKIEMPEVFVDDMIEAEDFGSRLSYKLVAHSNENGLFVDGAIIYFPTGIIENPNIEFSYIISGKRQYEIKDIYACSYDLKKTIGDTNYLYISIDPDSKAFPVINSNRDYDNPFNDLKDCYELKVNSEEIENIGLICPDLFGLVEGECYFEGTTIRYMAYENLEEDNMKNPIIIWLHGGGEGGMCPEVAVLGNEASALFKDEIQNYFRKDGSSRAYVLIPQCETMWMDADGNSSLRESISYGCQSSFYTEYLMATIISYVESNEDIDPTRIYVGGCSNGGYMTLELAFKCPEYFAAIYPICPGYKNTNISQEMIESIKELPIWIVQSIDDTILNPKIYEEPVYARIIESGNNNAYYSMYDKVRGTDMKDINYIGHYSWVYLFNNQVKKVQDKSKIKYGLGENNDYGFIGNSEGGTETVLNYDGIWDWMSSQKRR